MLKVEHVTKYYGKMMANKDISFEVGDGQIAILLGPNGAGKSTIIKSITGLLRFTGIIEIDGFANKSIEAKRIIGYIPEMPSIYDMLTVSEHLEFIRRAYRLSDDGYGEELLTRLELIDKKDKLGKELSKGMQQKLSICCALIHRPKVIIFDEPMVGLDPHAIKELKLMFRELKASGATLLISTHMIDSVEDYWDVAHIMVDGRFAATKRNIPDDVKSESLEELFFDITEGKKTPQKINKMAEDESRKIGGDNKGAQGGNSEVECNGKSFANKNTEGKNGLSGGEVMKENGEEAKGENVSIQGDNQETKGVSKVAER